MSILHTVNKSPFERNSLESCLKFVNQGDPVLLFEDGVYAVLKGTSAEKQLEAALAKQSIYVLGPDLAARGFSADRVIAGIKVVDYAGFVDLAAENDKVQAWL
ncbi:sulfurtransferase complex subunit TusB [Candidatus Thiosymbion oneisti]|uniref:sulfurtransferase complex subunit TusB n=1 Tax=Candidatus Thiosymbion oneisti TaxID=589554 RepID=UPI000A5224ED|nr:sulfurtransferase complex subunit TusB [Candidatus Thiosymbion oneisti]